MADEYMHEYEAWRDLFTTLAIRNDLDVIDDIDQPRYKTKGCLVPKDKAKKTPLLYSLGQDHIKKVYCLLLEKYSEAQCKRKNNRDYYPLDIAFIRGRMNAITVLLAYDAPYHKKALEVFKRKFPEHDIDQLVELWKTMPDKIAAVNEIAEIEFERLRREADNVPHEEKSVWYTIWQNMTGKKPTKKADDNQADEDAILLSDHNPVDGTERIRQELYVTHCKKRPG